MSMASVAAGLRTVLDGIARTRAGAAAGIEAAVRARDRLTAVTASSRHALVDQALQHVTAAIERLQVADRDAALAAAALVAYGRTLGITLPAPPPASAPTRGAAPVPSWIRQAGQDLPTRPDDHGPTHGQAFDSTGRPLSAEPWRSGRNIASTSDLRPIPGLKGFPWTLTDHVESRAAQQMRRPGAPREVSLVVNKEPCTDDPYGCDRILRHIIPAGSRLTIYVQDPNAPAGVRTVGQYEGTGKGIV